MASSARKLPFTLLQGGLSGALTWDDLNAVRGLLAEIAPGWSAELNQGSPNESTIVVVPQGTNDLIGPAFVLHRSGQSFRLDQFRWDEYRELGSFRTMEYLLAALRARLVPLRIAPSDFNGGGQ